MQCQLNPPLDAGRIDLITRVRGLALLFKEINDEPARGLAPRI